MKVYIVNYMNQECGQLEAFTNKFKAQQRYNELKKQKDEDEENEDGIIQQLFDINEREFEISAKGIIAALEYGARTVYK